MKDDAGARRLRATGDQALMAGHLAQADEAYRAALGLAESPAIEGEIWSSVAWLCQRRAALEEAEAALGAALAAFQRAGEPARCSAALQSRASLRWGRAHELAHGHHGAHHHAADRCEAPETHDAPPQADAIAADLRDALDDLDAAVTVAMAAGAAREAATARASRAALLRFAIHEGLALVPEPEAQARADLDGAITALLNAGDATGAALLACTEIGRARRAGARELAWSFAARVADLAAPPPVRARVLLARAELLADEHRAEEARRTADAARALLGAFPDAALRQRIDELLAGLQASSAGKA